MKANKLIRLMGITGMMLLVAMGYGTANPVRKTIYVGGFEREYLVYAPTHHFPKKAEGVIVCLHGFGRTMNDFFSQYDISAVADSLNMIIVAPQALPEQNSRVQFEATIISFVTNNRLSLHSVWGCGLGIRITSRVSGSNRLNEVLNKEVDDVSFIDRMIDELLLEYSLPEKNLFVLGTSMGGYMTYQYALKKGGRLSGIISIAGSMGLNISGKDYSTSVPVCDFHSTTDEVVPYTGSQTQLIYNVSLAQPKADVISYWTQTNLTGTPVTEQIQYYPSTNGVTVEKITYPDSDNEVIHYKMNGASHSYFFKKENGDCMDHVEEIIRFIQSHTTGNPNSNLTVKVQNTSFYPNPVHDRVFFRATTGIVSIYDLTGKNLYTQSFTDGQVDLSFLKPGTYIIRIQEGNTIQTGKLIKILKR